MPGKSSDYDPLLRSKAILIKDLRENRLLPVIIGNATGETTFESDTDSLYFIESDLYSRPYKLYRYCIKTNVKSLIYEETDEKFSLSRMAPTN